MKKALLHRLKTKGESTHTEILETITDEFKIARPRFEGSIEWHIEWVKLDLEARREIRRIGGKSHAKFVIVN